MATRSRELAGSAKQIKHDVNENGLPVRSGAADLRHRLPPIPDSAKRREDPYANSKLLTYRASKEKQNLLQKIMLDSAVKAYEDTRDQNIRDEQRSSSDEPTYPDQVSRDLIRSKICQSSKQSINHLNNHLNNL